MATKKFPSEMSSRGTVLGTDKILIYNATTGASDEVCTVAELFAYMHAAITTGNVPYKSATTYVDSPLSISGNNVGIGNASPIGTPANGFTQNANSRGLEINSKSDGGYANFYLRSYGTTVGLDITSDTLSTGAIYLDSRYITAPTTSGGFWFRTSTSGTAIDAIRIMGNGNVGIGKLDATYLLQVNTDSAGKPGAGGLWTVVSDERIKQDIELADLDICYDTIKNIPLKRFAWADGVYSEEQVSDRHNLGWIAQDVQKYFSKAVSVKPFTKNAKIADGVEEYQEQDFVMEDKKVTSIEIVNGNPIQVTKTVQEKVLLFDELPVKDELGKFVLENGKPLLAKVPKMVTKTRPKFRQEVIEDCLDLNSGQLNAALYGAVQACMLKIESLEQEIALLKQ